MAESPNSDVTTVDGAIDFSGGVDGIKVTTIQSTQNPNGLARNELAWCINGTVRDGGITPRSGWQPRGTVHDSSALYQGGTNPLYQPIDGSSPYLICSIGGQIFKVDPNTGTPTNLSQQFGLFNPPTAPKAYFCQGEQFLVIQAGDGVTLPLFWDGTILRRSNGLGGIVNQPGVLVIKNISDTANVGRLVQANGLPQNVFTNPPIPANAFGITGMVAFIMPAINATVTTSANVVGVPAALLAGNYFQALVLPSRPDITGNLQIVAVGQFHPPPQGQTVTILNIDDTTHVGQQVPPSGLFQAFIMPAVGHTVGTHFLNVPPYAGPIPSAPFQLFMGDQLPAVLTGNLQVITWQPPTTTFNGLEIPAATAMDYHMGRLWYAQNGLFNAGDIVGGPSGTLPYNLTDSILKITENPLAIGGDGFRVPRNAGNITALFHNAAIDTALGQGQLMVATPKIVFSLSVPVTRNDWIAATTNNLPLLKPVQLVNGAVNDWSVVPVNGDIFFQSLEPGIRSLISATRYFKQWANVKISSNEDRITQFNNLSLLLWASGISFDNRMLQTALPRQTFQGVVHQALVPLDFTSISNFQVDEVENPVWEGSYQGVDILQLYLGNFSGTDRAFAMMLSEIDQSMQLWEIVTGAKADNVDTRIMWQVEFPAFTWGNEFSLKQLMSGEIWIDRLYGEVVFKMEYRPDGETCWQPWHEWKVCAPRNSCENTGIDPCTGLSKSVCYPLEQFGESYRQTMTLPTPPNNCAKPMGRPSYIGFQFQPRLTIRGFCRLRGLLLHAAARDRKLYQDKVC